MTDLTPFTVSIDDTVIQDLKSRLNATRWPDEETVDDWTQGVPLAYQQLIAYWAHEYDHQRLAARLNACRQLHDRTERTGHSFSTCTFQPYPCAPAATQSRLAWLYC